MNRMNELNKQRLWMIVSMVGFAALTATPVMVSYTIKLEWDHDWEELLMVTSVLSVVLQIEAFILMKGVRKYMPGVLMGVAVYFLGVFMLG